MQGGRGVKIVIFMALRCKVMVNTRKTEGAWGKSFSGPPRGPEEQRTYEQRTRLAEHAGRFTVSRCPVWRRVDPLEKRCDEVPPRCWLRPWSAASRSSHFGRQPLLQDRNACGSGWRPRPL